MLCRMAFHHLVRWLTCILIIVLQKLIYVIKVVQNLSLQSSLLHIESGCKAKHGISIIPAYIHNHLSVEADYLLLGKLV